MLRAVPSSPHRASSTSSQLYYWMKFDSRVRGARLAIAIGRTKSSAAFTRAPDRRRSSPASARRCTTAISPHRSIATWACSSCAHRPGPADGAVDGQGNRALARQRFRFCTAAIWRRCFSDRPPMLGFAAAGCGRRGPQFKMKKNPNVAVAFFGEGAASRGDVHEAMKLCRRAQAACSVRVREQPLCVLDAA